MIGIFALAGWSGSELTNHAQKIAAGMRTKPSWEASWFATKTAAWGRIGPKRPEANCDFGDGRYRACMDGFAHTLSPGGPESEAAVGASDLAEAILFRGPDALLDFQGEFVLLVVDEVKRTIHAATDRFGLRTTYWHITEGRLAICSEIGLLIRLGLIPPRLNKSFVAGLLRFNKCRLGDETIFSDVKVIPPGTVLEYHLDNVC